MIGPAGDEGDLDLAGFGRAAVLLPLMPDEAAAPAAAAMRGALLALLVLVHTRLPDLDVLLTVAVLPRGGGGGGAGNGNAPTAVVPPARPNVAGERRG